MVLCSFGVSTSTLLPSAFMTAILVRSFVIITNAIFFPSGDQAGSSWSASSRVSCATFFPSMSIVKSCSLPESIEINTSFLPSGAGAGSTVFSWVSGIEIDQIWNAGDVVPVCHAQRFLARLQPRRHPIAPAQLGCESIPDKEIAFIESATFFEAPLQNLFIAPALEHALAQLVIIHAQKI